MPERNNNITYEIVEYIGVISSWESGWNRELNLISWNGAKPKYDIREWDEKHDRMSKGITLHSWEMRNLVDLYLTNNSEKAVEAGRMREAERRERRAEHRRTSSDPNGQLKAVSQAPPFDAEPAAGTLAAANTSTATGTSAAMDAAAAANTSAAMDTSAAVMDVSGAAEARLTEEGAPEPAQMSLAQSHTPVSGPEQETRDGHPLTETGKTTGAGDDTTEEQEF